MTLIKIFQYFLRGFLKLTLSCFLYFYCNKFFEMKEAGGIMIINKVEDNDLIIQFITFSIVITL